MNEHDHGGACVADSEEWRDRGPYMDEPWQGGCGVLATLCRTDKEPSFGVDVRRPEWLDDRVEVGLFQGQGHGWRLVEAGEMHDAEAVRLACGLLAAVSGTDADSVARLLEAVGLDLAGALAEHGTMTKNDARCA